MTTEILPEHPEGLAEACRRMWEVARKGGVSQVVVGPGVVVSCLGTREPGGIVHYRLGVHAHHGDPGPAANAVRPLFPVPDGADESDYNEAGWYGVTWSWRVADE